MCVSVFAEYGMQYTRMYKDSISYSSKENLERSGHTDFGTSQKSLVLVSKIETIQFYKEKPRPKYRYGATDIEVEEDELLSSKKIIKGVNYFTSFLSGRLHDHLYYSSKSSLAFCKQLSFVLSNKRYVFFHVFRI